MPKPSEWQHHKVDKPIGDNDYFERMSRVIFMSGLNWATIEKKWPGIRDAFDGFDIAKVADYDEAKMAALMENPAVIRNRPKIQAVVSNAREFQAVADESGSFEKYLGSLRAKGEEAEKAEIAKRFAFMGKGTTVIFLYACGEDMPKAHAEWESRHK
jgi:3-methyladenine DNA glycosylase Tag